jgi:hypothetical protein
MISSQTEVAVATGDYVLLGDTSDSNNLKKAPISSILAGTHTGAVTATTIGASGSTAAGVLTLESTAASALTITTTGANTWEFSNAGNNSVYNGYSHTFKNASSSTGLAINSSGVATFGSTVTIPTTAYVGTSIVHNGDADTSLDFDTNLIDIYAGGVLGIRVQPTAVTINEASVDYDFRVESNGNANMLFVDGGNDRVGIGTASPAATLDIRDGGGSTDPSLSLVSNTSSAYNHSINALNPNLTATEANIIVLGRHGSTNNSGYLGFKYASDGSNDNLISLGHWGNNFQLNITGDGKVGIGTESPASKLHVVGGDMATGTVKIHQNVATNNPTLFIEQTGEGGNTNVNQGLLIKVDGNNGLTGNIIRAIGTNSNAGADVEAFTVKNSGKVGIGTASPLTNLHIGSGTEGENLGLKINRGATTNFLVACDGTKQAYIGTDNGDAYIKVGSLSNHPVQISQNNANAIYIDTSKRVGIGTTSPASPTGYGTAGVLHLKGASGNDCSLVFEGMSGSGGRHEIGCSAGTLQFMRGAASGSMSESMRIDTSGRLLVGSANEFNYSGIIPKVTVDNGAGIGCKNIASADAGYATIPSASHQYYAGYFLNSSASGIGNISCSTSATTYNTSSDYRLKDVKGSVQNGLERTLALNPVEFEWKESGEVSEGFLAHEAQEIFADAVSGEKDGEDMQGMDYGRITPLLVKAIQELSAENDALKARITTLEG